MNENDTGTKTMMLTGCACCGETPSVPHSYEPETGLSYYDSDAWFLTDSEQVCPLCNDTMQ